MTDNEWRMAKQADWLAERLEELAPTHCPASLGKRECEEYTIEDGQTIAGCWVSAALEAVAAQEEEADDAQ